MVNNEILGYKTFRKVELEYLEDRKAECSAQNWRDESWAEKSGLASIGKQWQATATAAESIRKHQVKFNIKKRP